MIETFNVDAWQYMAGLPDKSMDAIITDPMYDGSLDVTELRRVCRGNIVVFCKPENQFFKPMNMLSGSSHHRPKAIAENYPVWLK